MNFIKLENCNCIKEASISLVPNSLNIKYGINGTGKSTISKAINLVSLGESLVTLRPYGVNETDETQPTMIKLNYNTISVFDDSYVNDKLLSKENFFDNPYLIFLNNGECADLENKISELLSDLHGYLNNSEELKELQLLALEYGKIFSITGKEIAKKGGVNEFLKGNGAGFENYLSLDSYKPFYENRAVKDVSDWANWRREGIDKMNGDNCPFCTIEMSEQITDQNELIKKVFKKAALSTAAAILEFINKLLLSGYVNEDELKILEGYIGNKNTEKEMHAALSQLGIEIKYLNEKIEYISLFRPQNVTKEELKKIEDSLEKMIISKDILKMFFKTKKVDLLIDKINEKVDFLIGKTRQLKSLFEAHEKKLNELVEKQKEDINEFLAIAGFPYEFILKPDGEKSAKAYLVPTGMENEAVKKPKERLSWGEKNAFSLVMFMFESINAKADLIVLDDPISSFDSNKKFAVVRRLFDNRKKSFRDKTVLMLTHDLQPIIDYVHGSMFNRMKLTTPVFAKWIQNINGSIVEKDITKDDLINVIELTKTIYINEDHSLHVRLVNLRKNIELTNQFFVEDPTYQLVSNLIHGRVFPTENDEVTPLDSAVIAAGEIELKKIFGEQEYIKLLENLSDDKLKEKIESGNDYTKVLGFRLLLERHNDLFKKLRTTEPGTYKYINETNHIENDYVFQLDPLKFYKIPVYYLDKLQKVIVDL